MGVLVEAIIAASESRMELVWTTAGTSTVIASCAVDNLMVTTTFERTGATEWQAAFAVAPETQSATAVAQRSLQILSGAFQAVREFLEVRQPIRLVFAGENQVLGSLYESYLDRQDSELRQVGYRVEQTRVEAQVAFALVKTSPSAWCP